MRGIDLGAVILLAACLAGCSRSNLNAESLASSLRHEWIEFSTGSSSSLRAVSAVSGEVAWASGSGGAVLRTTDAGQRWQVVSPGESANLDFRMLHAFDDRSACVLSAGSPARLYRTEDCGASWTLVYEDARPEVFFDAMQFADAQFGMAFGDAIEGRIQIISTRNGGRSWRSHDSISSPAARPGEAGFAASNSSLAMLKDLVLIGLGGQTDIGRARVARSRNRGVTWDVATTPMPATASSGIFSIALLNDTRAVAVGGDYLQPESIEGNLLVTKDGGREWRRPEGPPPRGYRSAAAPLSYWGAGVVIAAGPTGSDLSIDFGRSWMRVATIAWHSLSVTPDGRWLWSSGADGRIGRLDMQAPAANVSCSP